MTVFLDRIHTATLDAAAVAAFGVGTRILDSRLLGLGMSHVVYRVLIDRPPGACVFRFSRGVTDTFDNEIANFAAVSRLTGVRGPDIYAIDKSCDLAAVDICTHIDDHFLRGYTRTAGIALDTTFLSRLAVCRELSSWGFIATEAASRTRIPWIQSQRPRITDIMEEIQRAR